MEEKEVRKGVDELPKVHLFAYSHDGNKGPEEISVYGALGCFEERSSRELLEQDLEQLSMEKLAEKKEKVLRETSGRGHGSVLDQSSFTFVVEDLPRSATLLICEPQYLSHLQQSLRRSDAARGFFLSRPVIEAETGTKSLLNSAFDLYEEMKDENIGKLPAEDARYILPLATRTNIQTTGDARELMHLHAMSQREGVPAIVKYTVEQMIEKAREVAPALMKQRDTNYEVLAWCPSSQLFARQNKTLDNLVDELGGNHVRLIDNGLFKLDEEAIEKAVRQRDEAELANLKHMHYTFLAPMSLSTFHQATRQRTWDQSVESIYHAAKRGEIVIVIPPSIEQSTYVEKFRDLAGRMMGEYYNLIDRGVAAEEAIGVVPHALQVYDLIHVNGWNAIHSIGKRTCTEAQWEIRGIAKQMAEQISNVHPALGQYSKPQGIVYGRCPERKSCGKCKE